MENNVIDISKLNKAEVLATLYNASQPLGMGFFHFTPEEMTAEEAQGIIDERLAPDGDRTPDPRHALYFDYLKGRVMKIDLGNDNLRIALYDRDNGQGAAALALSHLLT